MACVAKLTPVISVLTYVSTAEAWATLPAFPQGKPISPRPPVLPSRTLDRRIAPDHVNNGNLFCVSQDFNNDRAEGTIATGMSKNRRSILSGMMSPALWLLSPCTASASENSLSPALTTQSLLESRVTPIFSSESPSSLPSVDPPPYSIECSDVLYPSYFAGGIWSVSSALTSVHAPCGMVCFGGQASFDKALEEVGIEHALQYRARFIRSASKNNNNEDNQGQVIADRDYNVREIAKAAMGSNAVVDVSNASPNQFSCLLLPATGTNMVSVDLVALARRQEQDEDKEWPFRCAEVVRQILSPAGVGDQGGKVRTGLGTRNAIIKEIETVSLYAPVFETVKTPNSDEDGAQINQIKCRQRTATYLVPRQDNPSLTALWQMSGGKAVDVRYYDVTYTRNQK